MPRRPELTTPLSDASKNRIDVAAEPTNRMGSASSRLGRAPGMPNPENGSHLT